LDACRDNPFEQVAGRSVGLSRGLAAAEPPEGTFIMYSAGAGESALDSLNGGDRNPNSVYTRVLLPLLTTEGVSLTEIAEQVRISVRQITSTVQHRQTPAYYNQVLGRVCLAGGDCATRATPPSAAAAPARLAEAAEAWHAVKDSTNNSSLEAYMARYKDTFYADLARARIEDLENQRGVGPSTHVVSRSPFDGKWTARTNGGPGCKNKQWSPTVSVEGTSIKMIGFKKTGRLTGDGNFEFYLPGALEDDFAVVVGRLIGNSGNGNYKYKSGLCFGTITLQRLQ
jgi:hypothetical protein